MPEDDGARCNVLPTDELDPGRNIKLVPKSNEGELTEKEKLDYREYRKKFLSWLLQMGKTPEKAEGYSAYTVYVTGYRTARFDLWVWQDEGRYMTPPTQEHVNQFMREVAFDDTTNSTKGKVQEALRHYNKWLCQKFGTDEWDFQFAFDSSGSDDHPADFLTPPERQKIRQAALNRGSIPSYHGLLAEERNQWKSHVGKVVGKPADEVTEEDWDRVEGWKITSMVWTSLDAGLRPVEVGRARTTWVDTTNKVLRIPKDESSKNRENWTVSITDRTAHALERWLEEREKYPRYDNTDALWLTSHGNPYASQSLSRLLKKLCEDAGIETSNRTMSWYSIRHSVGTYMTKERDLAATKAQLRHKNAKTTMKYDRVPVEDRRDALDKMG